MDCSSLPRFLETDLPAEAQALFEQHLVACGACQAAVEAAIQLSALGAELAKRPDRPHACAALADPGWSTEAAARRDALRGPEDERTRRLKRALQGGQKLASPLTR